MSVFNKFRTDTVIKRVLAQGSPEHVVLRQHTCLRCQYTWWPRRPTKPLRCPECKSPYWDRPRRLKQSKPAVLTPGRREDLKASLRMGLAGTLGLVEREPVGGEDRSLSKALDVLRDMKAAGRTWHEMAERMAREFCTTLDKDQLKALVR
jgi:hypothetical protein